MVHCDDEANGAWLPGRHGDGKVAPVPQALPGGQTAHSLLLPRPVEFDHEPGSHGSAAAAPGLQKWPGRQSAHAVAPSAAWKLPAAHLAQEGALAVLAIVPGAHAICSLLPVGAE